LSDKRPSKQGNEPMTPQMLDRASQGFRRGYRDAYEGNSVNPYPNGVFAYFDWIEGFDAAMAEIRRK
jgi:hypothetical protein